MTIEMSSGAELPVFRRMTRPRSKAKAPNQPGRMRWRAAAEVARWLLFQIVLQVLAALRRAIRPAGPAIWFTPDRIAGLSQDDTPAVEGEGPEPARPDALAGSSGGCAFRVFQIVLQVLAALRRAIRPAGPAIWFTPDRPGPWYIAG
jgi:hypothetical protein